MAHAACALQSLPVYWYRRVKPNNATRANVSNTKLEDESLLSPLPLLKRKMSCFGRSISSLSSESNSVPDDEIYVKFDAVLSVCDTDSGPAIELRTISKTFAGMLEKYELADINEKMDEITHLPASLNSFPILERIIPLSMIECAALGGKWDLENFLNVGGTVDCGIKVYSSAKDFQLVGHGKKVLLFDLKNGESVLSRNEAIAYINSLAEWDRARVAYASQVGDQDDSNQNTVPGSCC